MRLKKATRLKNELETRIPYCITMVVKIVGRLEACMHLILARQKEHHSLCLEHHSQ